MMKNRDKLLDFHDALLPTGLTTSTLFIDMVLYRMENVYVAVPKMVPFLIGELMAGRSNWFDTPLYAVLRNERLLEKDGQMPVEIYQIMLFSVDLGTGRIRRPEIARTYITSYSGNKLLYHNSKS